MTIFSFPPFYKSSYPNLFIFLPSSQFRWYDRVKAILFTRIVLYLEDIFWNVLRMGDERKKQYSRVEMKYKILLERLEVEFASEKLSWEKRGVQEGRGGRGPGTKWEGLQETLVNWVCKLESLPQSLNWLIWTSP